MMKIGTAVQTTRASKRVGIVVSEIRMSGSNRGKLGVQFVGQGWSILVDPAELVPVTLVVEDTTP